MSRALATIKPSDKTNYRLLYCLANEVERIRAPSRWIDIEIMLALAGMPRDALYIDVKGKMQRVIHAAAYYTTGFNPARSFGGLLVFASDIGADGLPMAKVVFDTGTSPIVEHVGIGHRLEFALLSATLRGLSYGKC